MATAMLTERGLRRKIVAEEKKTAAAAAAAAAAADTASTITSAPVTTRKATKRKSTAKVAKAPAPASTTTPAAAEQNNNVKRLRLSPRDTQDEMLSVYQPWVIQTYGDLAKTKTITVKKYARILRTLRGEEMISADNSKFRFWVKAKGFHMGAPPGYDAKPADSIVGRHSVCDMDGGIPPLDEKLLGSAKDPPLYVPNAPFKNSTGEPVYRKVAIVENFFDIIYNVHVELEGRPGKHAGQKRTYRTITETYAFLPREAVTRFLLGCTDCQKHPRSPSPLSAVLPTPSPSPTLPPCSETAATVVAPATTDPNPSYNNNNISNNNNNSIAMIGATAGHHDNTAVPFTNGSTDASPIIVNASATSKHLSTPKRSHSQDEDEDEDTTLSKPASPCQQICVEATATPDAGDTSATSRRSNNPLDVCNLTARDPPKNQRKRRKTDHISEQAAVNGLVTAGSANASGQDPSYASANISSNCSSTSSGGSRNCSRPNSPSGPPTPHTPPPHGVPPGAASPLAFPPAVPTHTYPTSTVTVTTTTGAAAPATGNAGQQGAITVLTSSPGVALSVGVTTPTVNGILHSSNNSSAATPSTPKLWSPVASIEREQQQRLLQQQQQQQQQRYKNHPLQHQYLYGSMDLHLQQQFLQPQQQHTLPITTTYLKYMRSLGCSDEDAMQLDTHNVSRIIDTLVCDWMKHYFY